MGVVLCRQGHYGAQGLAVAARPIVFALGIRYPLARSSMHTPGSEKEENAPVSEVFTSSHEPAYSFLPASATTTRGCTPPVFLQKIVLLAPLAMIGVFRT